MRILFIAVCSFLLCCKTGWSTDEKHVAVFLLIGQSNAGLPHLVGDHFEYDADPATMAAHAAEVRGMGVDIIGGCCGSTPAHIAAISEALNS